MPSPGESVAEAIEKQFQTDQPTEAAPAPAALSGTLPLLNQDSAVDRWFYLLAALVVVAALLFANYCQNVPAHGGVDQNGYLVGGKMIAHTGTMKLAPQRPGSTEFDPHQFVGRMYVGADLGTPSERYYPKYPLGYPALIALALQTGGVKLVYWINPIAMTSAVLATFLIARLIANSFVAVLAALAFATSPTTLLLSTNPNSHATAVCFVSWGMYLLIRWWQSGGRVRAIFAGFLIGYAATIRYTEGTLALPIGLAILFNLRWRDRRSWIESGLLTLGWLVPVSILLIYNKCAMGTWTGYDPTNESDGFSWSYAIDNWETMLRQLTTSGLFFLFPLAIAGLIMMFWWNWKLACIFAAWIVPCLTVYTFYYWAPDGSLTSYLRFFETIIPALAVCAMWMLKTVSDLFVRAPVKPVAAAPASPL
jgi:4-amino-4-deoxy-L-arabinose transferase-like glycosyltransferase